MITAEELAELMLKLAESEPGEEDGSWHSWNEDELGSTSEWVNNPDYNPELPQTYGRDSANPRRVSVPKSGEYLPSVGNVYLHEEAGGEGQGDHAHKVFRLVPEGGGPDRYFMLPGYYHSFHGTEWDGELFEVKPVKKVVDDWDKVA